MADTALILGLAGMGGTLAGTFGSAWVTARFATSQQERTFEHERTMRDEEELRKVLDEVASCLDRCNRAMHDTRAQC